MKKARTRLVFTDAIQRTQSFLGAESVFDAVAARGGWEVAIPEELAEFIGRRDSFYLGTASRSGRPYIQHRGGPRGFLKVLDETTLAVADFHGNRQFVSMGNLSENEHAFLFLMDYPSRRRVKIWGWAEVVDDAELLDRLADPEYGGRPHRVIRFHVEAWDANCPQHIQRRYTVDEFDALEGPLSAP